MRAIEQNFPNRANKQTSDSGGDCEISCMESSNENRVYLLNERFSFFVTNSFSHLHCRTRETVA